MGEALSDRNVIGEFKVIIMSHTLNHRHNRRGSSLENLGALDFIALADDDKRNGCRNNNNDGTSQETI